MNRRRALVLAFVMLFTATLVAFSNSPNLAQFLDPSGMSQTFTSAGSIDGNNAFFKDIGTNGRTCASCHQPGEGWTVTPASIQTRFAATQALDLICRTNDVAN